MSEQEDGITLRHPESLIEGSGVAHPPEDNGINYADILTTVQNQIGRYFVARYGNEVGFRAPETFDNALERWMLYVSGGSMDLAEKEMALIERKCAESRA